MKGLDSVSVNVNKQALTYDLVDDLQDGDVLFVCDTRYPEGRQFVGEGGFCEGGTYLSPSLAWKIPLGTSTSIHGSMRSGTNVEVCYFVKVANEMADGASSMGIVPKCCHSDAPPNTPTICYNVEIDCRDNTQRSLRGISL